MSPQSTDYRHVVSCDRAVHIVGLLLLASLAACSADPAGVGESGSATSGEGPTSPTSSSSLGSTATATSLPDGTSGGMPDTSSGESTTETSETDGDNPTVSGAFGVWISDEVPAGQLGPKEGYWVRVEDGEVSSPVPVPIPEADAAPYTVVSGSPLGTSIVFRDVVAVGVVNYTVRSADAPEAGLELIAEGAAGLNLSDDPNHPRGVFWAPVGGGAEFFSFDVTTGSLSGPVSVAIWDDEPRIVAYSGRDNIAVFIDSEHVWWLDVSTGQAVQLGEVPCLIPRGIIRADGWIYACGDVPATAGQPHAGFVPVEDGTAGTLVRLVEAEPGFQDTRLQHNGEVVVAFYSVDRPVEVVFLSGKRVVAASELYARSPRISPSLRTLAGGYEQDGAIGGHVPRVISIAGGGHDVTLSANGPSFAWLPDGDVLLAADRLLPAPRITSTNFGNAEPETIFLHDGDLFPQGTVVTSISPSANGTRALVLTEEPTEGRHAYQLSVEGTDEPWRFTTDDASLPFAAAVEWAPDEQGILYESESGDSHDVYYARPGQAPTLLVANSNLGAAVLLP